MLKKGFSRQRDRRDVSKPGSVGPVSSFPGSVRTGFEKPGSERERVFQSARDTFNQVIQ